MTTYVLTICIASCLGMIVVTLIKPKICIKNVTLGTYWMATMVGAILLVACGFLSPIEVIGGLTADSAINPLKILILFISMTILSIFLDETGFFRYLANSVLKKAGTSQLKLFSAFYLVITILTIFTSNDIIILTFTPFICYFAKNAKVNPLPYLVSAFVAANTSSMLLIIGNPTNIYLATASGITFLEYMQVMALPTFFATVVAYLVMLLVFFKALKLPLTGQPQQVTIEKRYLLVIGLVLLILCTVLLVISSYVGLEMWLIAFGAAVVLVVVLLSISLSKRTRAAELERTLRRAPWELVPFVISMFVITLSLEKYEVTKQIAAILGEGNTIFTYGFSSVLLANLMNNIPMSVLFSSVLSNLSATFAAPTMFAVAIGSNIGAFLTPVGALAGIMWLQILRENGIEFSFLKFAKYGFVIAVPTLLAALFGLLLATTS